MINIVEKKLVMDGKTFSPKMRFVIDIDMEAATGHSPEETEKAEEEFAKELFNKVKEAWKQTTY